MTSIHKASKRAWNGSIALCMAVLVFISGCGMKEMASTWRDREVVINGKDEGLEWNGAKYYFQDENITLGLMNDDDYLYIRLSTGNTERQQQVLRQGLTVWFDKGCGKNKNQGVRYPRGGMMMRMGGGGMGAGAARPGQNPAVGAVQGQQSSAGNEEIELIGFTDSGKQAMSLGAADSLGFTASLTNASGLLTYELRVPISACKQVSQESDIEPGTMYLCFDVSAQTAATPPISTGGFAGSRTGSAPAGGSGGASGGMRGGRGGMGGGMGAPGAGATMQAPTTPQGMESWLKVKLASANITQ